jgi:cysteine desulfuration protein SufE
MQPPEVDIPPKLAALLETIDEITDEAERANVLIDYASKFKGVPAQIATRPYPEDHRVQFCESEAYIWDMEQPDGTLKFYFAVENPSGISAKALAVILDKTLSGAKPEQVANVSQDIVYRIFRQNISMGKGMGLMSMVQNVQALARQYLERAGARSELANPTITIPSQKG